MERTCKSCGDTFTWTSTRPNGSGRPAQYCSQRCRNNQPRQCSVCGTTVIRHAADGWRKPNQLVTCSNECRSVVTPGRAGLHSQLPDDHPAKWYGATSDWTPPPPKPARFVSARCDQCGERFIGDQSAHWTRQVNTYCSDACSRKRNKRIDKDKRRARKRDAYVADVNRRKVYESDNWRCHLCGKKVKRAAKAPDPMAPTIDHVVPLAQGGTHEPANCRTAHFICNAQKGARGGGEQMLLLAV